MVFKLKTSKETMQIFEKIGAVTHLQPFALCKIALALSIRNNDKLSDNAFLTDSDGLELNRQTITAEYDELFKALIICHTGRVLSDDEYFPKYMKAHIDRGANYLSLEFKYSKGNIYKHLIELDKGI